MKNQAGFGHLKFFNFVERFPNPNREIVVYLKIGDEETIGLGVDINQLQYAIDNGIAQWAYTGVDL